MPVGPWEPRAVLARFCHDGRHGFPSRAVTLEILGVRQRDHGERPEEPLRGRPLLRTMDFTHRVAVVAARRIVQRPMHENVIGGTTAHSVHRHADRSAEFWPIPSKPATYRGLAPRLRASQGEDTMLTPSTTCRPPALGSRLELTNPSTWSTVSPASAIAALAVSTASAPMGRPQWRSTLLCA